MGRMKDSVSKEEEEEEEEEEEKEEEEEEEEVPLLSLGASSRWQHPSMLGTPPQPSPHSYSALKSPSTSPPKCCKSRHLNGNTLQRWEPRPALPLPSPILLSSYRVLESTFPLCVGNLPTSTPNHCKSLSLTPCLQSPVALHPRRRTGKLPPAAKSSPTALETSQRALPSIFVF
ncbi:hypothetical protein VitviT2T_028877 [Vitis vinifera]|uniref:Uncharacterized protein n=1 Tax=Vitis vinifera TaxID=29760 RepID=A0ABY9DUG0_VITVI|nr:hypothetical protein VitviT2T_028877 [Vitis vinifera]